MRSNDTMVERIRTMRTRWKWLAYSTLISPLVVTGCGHHKSTLMTAKKGGNNSLASTSNIPRKFDVEIDGQNELVLPASFQVPSATVESVSADSVPV